MAVGGRLERHRLDLPGRVHPGGTGHGRHHRLCGAGARQPVVPPAQPATRPLRGRHLLRALPLPLADLRMWSTTTGRAWSAGPCSSSGSDCRSRWPPCRSTSSRCRSAAASCGAGGPGWPPRWPSAGPPYWWWAATAGATTAVTAVPPGTGTLVDPRDAARRRPRHLGHRDPGGGRHRRARSGCCWSGDSEASFLGFGLGPDSTAHGVYYQGDGVFGCGLSVDTTRFHGTW